MVVHTKTSLTALKVAELKELCTASGLPVTGNKPDLVSRLLAHQKATSSPAAAASAVHNTTFPEPKLPPSNGAGSGTDAAPAPIIEANVTTANAGKTKAAPGTTTTIDAGPEGTTQQPTAAAPSAAVGSTAEEKRAALDAELAKRKARAERFGLANAAGGPTDPEALAKLERAKRFGTGEQGKDGEGKEVMNLGALDRALGEGRGKHGGERQGRDRRGRRQGGKDTGGGGNHEQKKPAPKKEKERLAPKEKTAADLEWEEKKRQRAERFGALVTGEPEAKKTRV